MPVVGFKIPPQESLEEMGCGGSDVDDYHPDAQTTGSGAGSFAGNAAATSCHSAQPVPEWAPPAAVPVASERLSTPVGGACAHVSFSAEDGEVADVLDTPNGHVPQGEASPTEAVLPEIQRSNTVLSECSVVDHGSGTHDSPAVGGGIAPVAGPDVTSSYATAVESVAVHKLTVRELLRQPPVLPGTSSEPVSPADGGIRSEEQKEASH
jgi:hypothetical protein